MADDASQQPIVVKKIKKVVGGAHGGAWKIAYADFVTAMMAFFLLMWLLGSTSEDTKAGISEYFKTPLEVAMGSAGTGDSTSVIQGGGTDMTRSAGQVNKTAPEEIQSTKKKAARAERQRKEVVQLKKLKAKIEDSINANPSLRKFKKQLLIDITTDGLRIQIIDAKNRPMFSSGKAELQPYTKIILREIGKTLNDVPNKISLAGHTDATPFPSGNTGRSNWELSADRANASRRELIAGGMDTHKILRVVGLASAVLYDKINPLNPNNRRISITVMNKEAERAITKDGGTLGFGPGGEYRKELKITSGL